MSSTETDSLDVTMSSSTSTYLNKSLTRSKLLSGEFHLQKISGRSKIWNVFCKIVSDSSEELPNVVGCKICKNAYAYNGKSTSNLDRHKCYLALSSEGSSNVKKEVDRQTKLESLKKVTEWTVKNCRPFRIVEDIGFLEISEFFINVGAKYGSDVDIKSLLPHPTTISRNINKLYEVWHKKIEEEISPIKDNGISCTSDLWTDNYLKKTYIVLTAHYIKEGKLFSRLLGMKSMKGEKSTSQNVRNKVLTILNEFSINSEKIIIVTDRGSNMVAAFRNNENLYCIDYLLHNTLQKSMQDILEVEQLCKHCTKLVKYFKITSLNCNLSTTLKSFSPTRWNSLISVFISLQRNWAEIIQTLQQKNEMERISNININLVNEIIKVMEPFEEAFKKLQGEDYPTLHLVFIYIHRLKKICANSPEDSETMKELKEKLVYYLNTIVFSNLNIYHKIALFLFPPANQLSQIDDNEKIMIKSKCVEIMKSFNDDLENQNIIVTEISDHNSEIFSDFLNIPSSSNVCDRAAIELQTYETIQVNFHDEFDVLQWWHMNRLEFPLLYKLSCKILATPASSAPSERTFSLAGNLISEKRCKIASNDFAINTIMFLHKNINQEEVGKELTNIELIL